VMSLRCHAPQQQTDGIAKGVGGGVDFGTQAPA